MAGAEAAKGPVDGTECQRAEEVAAGDAEAGEAEEGEREVGSTEGTAGEAEGIAGTRDRNDTLDEALQMIPRSRFVARPSRERNM